MFNQQIKYLILNSIRSFGELSKFVLFARKPDVILYYPQHFNRSTEGENPFFKPIVSVCNENGINVRLFEEPDFGTDKPRNAKVLEFDFFFLLTILIRKLYLKISPGSTQDKTDGFAAKIIDLISLGKFRAKVIITISNSNIRLWSSLNKKGKVCEMQHGIIYVGHPGYFDTDGHINSVLLRPNVNILLWGRGYEECFSRGEEAALKGRIHVVGYPIPRVPVAQTDGAERRLIVVSMQFTHDASPQAREIDKRELWKFLEATEGLGYKVVLKHHPRFNGAISVDDMLSRFSSFASLTSEPLEALAGKALLHVTFTSTTAFEYAEYGVPTYFLPLRWQSWAKNLFYGEYDYPLYQRDSITDVVNRLSNPDNYKKDSDVVCQWYQKFYSPFDKKLFLKLLG